MAISMVGGEATLPPLAAALMVIARTALGLLVHGLVRPGRAAVIERSTGKVRSK